VLDNNNSRFVLVEGIINAKNAAIVLADADIELAVRECLAGALGFNDQRCTALKMLIVHRSIAEPFLARRSRN
jgi:glyceraldehyde-3-phosphate dehydrogenase (NADP+)